MISSVYPGTVVGAIGTTATRKQQQQPRPPSPPKEIKNEKFAPFSLCPPSSLQAAGGGAPTNLDTIYKVLSMFSPRMNSECADTLLGVKIRHILSLPETRPCGCVGVHCYNGTSSWLGNVKSADWSDTPWYCALVLKPRVISRSGEIDKSRTKF